MKPILTTALTIILGLLAYAPLNAEDSNPKTINTLNVSIKGMTCEGCANGVTAALKKLNGVSMAHVNFDEKSASIQYLLDETNEKQIIKTIEKSGYKVSVKKGVLADDCCKVKSKKSAEPAAQLPIKTKTVSPQ